MATPLQCNLIAVVESSTVSTDILGPTYSLFPYGTRTLNMYLVVPRHLEQTPLRINQQLSDPAGCQQDSMQLLHKFTQATSLLCWYHWRLGQRSNENLTMSSLFLLPEFCAVLRMLCNLNHQKAYNMFTAALHTSLLLITSTRIPLEAQLCCCTENAERTELSMSSLLFCVTKLGITKKHVIMTK